MSIQAVAWALEQDIGDAAAKLVLISLANAVNGKTGRCFPTVEQICKESSCSESTVRRKLKWLESNSWISIHAEFSHDGRQLANSYTLGCQDDRGGVSHRQGEGSTRDTLGGVNCDTPIKEPEEIPEVSSAVDARPQDLGVNAAADLSQKQNLDLRDLTKKLTEAAGDKIQPHGSLVVGTILELINNGVDLETDILPTISAVASRMSKPASSWAYFVGAIRDAYNNRIKAGEGLVKPATVTKIDVFAMPQAEQERKLEFFLEQARLHRRWNPRLGALPWQDGCRIPEHLLKPDDGKGWQIIGVAA